jgi:predicted alpha/beta-fold hydrolase
MDLFLTVVFLHRLSLHHQSVQIGAGKHTLYSLVNTAEAAALLDKTQRIIDKNQYIPPLYCSIDICGNLQTLVQFIIRGWGAYYLVSSGRVRYVRENLVMADGAVIALDWAVGLNNNEVDNSSSFSGGSNRSGANNGSNGNINKIISNGSDGKREEEIGNDLNNWVKENDPKGESLKWVEDDMPTIVMHHGLCGDSFSEHIVLQAHTFLTNRRPFRVVVVVARGCGGLPLQTSDGMNGARTEDLKEAIAYIQSKRPKSRLFGVGFSLGAAILLNHLGEVGAEALLEGAAAVCPPWDGRKRGPVFPLWGWVLALPVKMYAIRHRDQLKKGGVDVWGVLKAWDLKTVSPALHSSFSS